MSEQEKPSWYNPRSTKRCPKCHKVDTMFTVCLECLNRARSHHEQFEDEWELTPECKDSALENWNTIVELRAAGVGLTPIMERFGLDRYTVDWVLKRAEDKGQRPCRKKVGRKKQ